MRNEARLTINGRKWRIRLLPARSLPRGVLGDCDTPPGPHPTIRVRRSQSQRMLTDTLVHEVLHASLPQLSEEAVTQAATDIARALISLGWRRRSLPSPQVSK